MKITVLSSIESKYINIFAGFMVADIWFRWSTGGEAGGAQKDPACGVG